MAGLDTSEGLAPFLGADGAGAGAILFDASRLRQADAQWLVPEWWGDGAEPVTSGGRGAAWFVDGGTRGLPFGPAVLRRYLRGGLVGRFNHDRHLWRGPSRVRSFEEFRLLRELGRRGLPVPVPIGAAYWRDGVWYRAAILIERLQGVRALADLARDDAGQAPWKAAGALIARCHRVGLDHADLNAHNLLFDAAGKRWVIDLDRSRIRIPATDWRERNLARLLRSLHKLAGEQGRDVADRGFQVLRASYDAQWQRGT